MSWLFSSWYLASDGGFISNNRDNERNNWINHAIIFRNMWRLSRHLLQFLITQWTTTYCPSGDIFIPYLYTQLSLSRRLIRSTVTCTFACLYYRNQLTEPHILHSYPFHSCDPESTCHNLHRWNKLGIEPMLSELVLVSDGHMHIHVITTP